MGERRLPEYSGVVREADAYRSMTVWSGRQVPVYPRRYSLFDRYPKEDTGMVRETSMSLGSVYINSHESEGYFVHKPI